MFRGFLGEREQDRKVLCEGEALEMREDKRTFLSFAIVT